MKRWNLVINGFLFLCSLLTVGSAILLYWRLPSGRTGAPHSFLGWDRHQWGDLHWWIGVLLMTGVAVHLALHWKWIWKIAVSQRKMRLWIGLAMVGAVIAFFTLVPVRPVAGFSCDQPASSPMGGRERGSLKIRHSVGDPEVRASRAVKRTAD